MLNIPELLIFRTDQAFNLKKKVILTDIKLVVFQYHQGSLTGNSILFVVQRLYRDFILKIILLLL